MKIYGTNECQFKLSSININQIYSNHTAVEVNANLFFRINPLSLVSFNNYFS